MVTTSPAVGAALTRPTDVERPERASAAVIESEGGLQFQPDFASFGARLIGLLIDTAALALCLAPGIVVVVVGSGPLVALGVVLVIVGFVGVTALYANAVAESGQWFGNRATSTRVVDARHGQTVPAAAAATRFVIRMLISPILLFGFLMALGNAERRTFHDNFAGTVVTRPTRASWSIDDEAPYG